MDLGALFPFGCLSSDSSIETLLKDYVAAECTQMKGATAPHVVEESRAELNESVGSEDREARELFTDMMKPELEKTITIDILSRNLGDNRGTVEAKIRRPTEEVIRRQLLQPLREAAEKHEGGEKLEVFSALNESVDGAFDGGDYETRTERRTFELRKEDGEWRIDPAS